MLDREEVLVKAVEDCYREMFAKAQPMADWDNLITEYKAGKIDEKKDGPVYDRHYLSYQEYVYIIEKYLDAYNVKSEWRSDIEVLEDYLNNGGSKDKYIEAHTDENGNYHPGYRGYEKVAPLNEQINEIITDFHGGKRADQENLVKKITDKVMELITTCKDFYNFNSDECKFRNTLAFGATPTSNAKTVKQWWKEHYDVDIEIEERNPLLFWERDYYGDNFEEVMEEEYGENWKADWDKKWKDDIAKKEAEREERLKKIQEDYKNFKGDEE
jgi:hypothetical protein